MSAERFFDDLARTLAEPMPRRGAVRVVGVSLVSLVVPGLASRPASASVVAAAQAECPRGKGCCFKGPDSRGTVLRRICGDVRGRWQCGTDGFTCTDTCPPVNGGTGQRQVFCRSAAEWPDGQPQRFNCCPRPDTECKDGRCLPSCDVLFPNAGYVRCGENCCPDYCCNRIFTRKGPTCCGLEEAEKAGWKDFEVGTMILLVGLGVATVFTGGAAAAFLVGAVAATGAWQVAAKIIGDDPPDPKYKALFRPVVPRMASVRPGNGVSPAAARALDSVLANRLRAGSYMFAYIRSIEKAQGAEKARDESWAKRHRKAAAGYAREAAKTLERDRSLSTAALRELERGGFVDMGATLGQAQQWLHLVRQRGLPAEATRALRAAGIEDARIAAFRTALGRLDPKLVVGVGAFGNVTDARLAAANAAAIKALRRAGRA